MLSLKSQYNYYLCTSFDFRTLCIFIMRLFYTIKSFLEKKLSVLRFSEIMSNKYEFSIVRIKVYDESKCLRVKTIKPRPLEESHVYFIPMHIDVSCNR